MAMAKKVASELREATTLSFMSLTGAAIAIAAVVGIILTFMFADAERNRDTQAWKERLGIVAETRSAAIADWVETQYRELGGLAENASLQLYMTELSRRPDQTGTPPAEAEYLQNLLEVVADRTGFKPVIKGPDVAANVDRVAISGIALVDDQGRTVAATRGMPSLRSAGMRPLVFAEADSRGYMDIRKAPSGELVMGFSVPVHAVQADEPTARPIGRIVGIRQVVDGLFPLVRQPGFTWQTAEIYLVRARGEVVEFLTPRRGDRAALTGAQALATDGLVAAIAAQGAASFGSARDYAGTDVLFAARGIDGTPWSLAVNISAEEAMGESEARRKTLIAAFLVLIALVVVGLIAVWRHGTSLRASAAAAKFRDLAHRYEAQSRFLRLVADSQPNPMFIVDDDSRFRFANRAAAIQADARDEEMIGKSLKSVLGTADAKRYETLNASAFETGKSVSKVHRSGSNGDLRVVQADHIPVYNGPDFDTGVLVVEQDITRAVSEREHRELALKQLVRTLVAAVDSRDPYAANHSTQVAVVARAIAEEMGLDELEIDAAETAGNLMNIGKLLVPADLLTSTGELGPGEVEQIRDGIARGIALLDDVPFTGPVVETLRQMTEKWDGSGTPRGLKGEDIIVTARIVAVANAFVAMLNPRAWRPGADFDHAVDRLLEASGTDFDRSVVAALINRLENRGGRAEWAMFSEAGAAH